jgi:hypothetical protein
MLLQRACAMQQTGELSILPLTDAAPEVGLQPNTDDFDAAIEYLEYEGYIEEDWPSIGVGQGQGDYRITLEGEAWIED